MVRGVLVFLVPRPGRDAKFPASRSRIEFRKLLSIAYLCLLTWLTRFQRTFNKCSLLSYFYSAIGALLSPPLAPSHTHSFSLIFAHTHHPSFGSVMPYYDLATHVQAVIL